ncbi:MAG: hypothetical protein AAB788_00295 [Patescibacteria group bacterium]
MNGNQAQIKISVSDQLNDLIKLKAASLGVQEDIEKISEKAIKDLDNSIVVDDIDNFFNNTIIAAHPTRLV